jgi:hypothetical protein
MKHTKKASSHKIAEKHQKQTPTYLRINTVTDTTHKNGNVVLILRFHNRIRSIQEPHILDPQTCFFEGLTGCAGLEGFAEFEMSTW